MRICVLTRTTFAHSVGGIEDHIGILYRGILKKNHEIQIITTAHPQGKEHEIIDGLEIFFIKGTKPGAYTNAWQRKSIEKFKELYQQKKYDLVHSQSSGALGLIEDGIAKKYNIPIIASIHGTTYDEYKTRLNVVRYLKGKVSFWNRLKTSAERRGDKVTGIICNKADAVIATSYEQAKILQEIYGTEKEKINLVFNGMNLDLFTPGVNTEYLRNKLHLSEREKVLLCMARMEIDKGVQCAIAALPRILKIEPHSKLVVVGDGSYKKNLEKLTKELKISDNVIFTGYINLSEVADYMNLADVFINYTLRQNGYDLTILEAMACGTPVVASLIGSHPTLIEDGKSGFLIPLWNIDQLKDKIINILQDQALKEKITEAARTKVLKDFSDKTMVEKTLEVFKKSIQRKEGGNRIFLKIREY